MFCKNIPEPSRVSRIWGWFLSDVCAAFFMVARLLVESGQKFGYIKVFGTAAVQTNQSGALGTLCFLCLQTKRSSNCLSVPEPCLLVS